MTLFQQDNARHHTAHVLRYLDKQHVRVLPWLAFSPDFVPIEHLWDVLNHHIRRYPQNADQLEEILHHEWEAILLHEIQNLIQSMHRHDTTVINALSLTQTEGTNDL
mgnify:CR=1 FL=1